MTDCYWSLSVSESDDAVWPARFLEEQARELDKLSEGYFKGRVQNSPSGKSGIQSKLSVFVPATEQVIQVFTIIYEPCTPDLIWAHHPGERARSGLTRLEYQQFLYEVLHASETANLLSDTLRRLKAAKLLSKPQPLALPAGSG